MNIYIWAQCQLGFRSPLWSSSEYLNVSLMEHQNCIWSHRCSQDTYWKHSVDVICRLHLCMLCFLQKYGQKWKKGIRNYVEDNSEIGSAPGHFLLLHYPLKILWNAARHLQYAWPSFPASGLDWCRSHKNLRWRVSHPAAGPFGSPRPRRFLSPVFWVRNLKRITQIWNNRKGPIASAPVQRRLADRWRLSPKDSPSVVPAASWFGETPADTLKKPTWRDAPPQFPLWHRLQAMRHDGVWSCWRSPPLLARNAIRGIFRSLLCISTYIPSSGLLRIC